MNRLSVVIITKDEEANIGPCLDSVAWADEVVVVDSGSTDRTLEICAGYPVKVLRTSWLGFARTKQLGVEAATNDWVFSLDADEVVTPELREGIARALEEPRDHGFRVEVRTFYLGRLIRHCGWGNEFHLRLFDRRFGGFDQKPVHESVQVSGSVGRLAGHVLHYSYPRLETHMVKINRYSALGAEVQDQKGMRGSVSRAVFSGLAKFLKTYFWKRGFLDGREGFVLSVNSAFGVYLKYLKLWERQRASKPRD